MTTYVQAGWGDSIQIGYIDEDGDLWSLSAKNNDINLPTDAEEQLRFLEENRIGERIGALPEDILSDVLRLVACVSASDTEPVGAADDAGTQLSCAARSSASGERELIMLGISGDFLLVNTDPAAQALYAVLREYFPDVTDYEGESIAPRGFAEQSLLAFCGITQVIPEDVSVEVCSLDCESGPVPLDVSAEQAADFLARLPRMRVTGMKNCFCVTGGTTIWTVNTASGEHIASFEFYGDALVRSDGMYSVELAEADNANVK